MIDRHRRHALCFILAAIPVTARAATNEDVSTPPEVTEEVVAALLNSLPAAEIAIRLLVFQPMTVLASEVFPGATAFADEIRRRLPQASEEVISSFLQASAVVSPIPLSRPLIRPEIQYVVATPAQLTELYVELESGDFWKAFNNAFPKATGLFRLSGVGFARRTGQALLFMSYSCGLLCGAGYLALLRRNLGEWRVESKVQLWVS